MTIPLPPLPDKIPVGRHISTGVITYGYTQEMMRAIQREAMRVAIEAAAELVHTEYLDAFLFGTKDAATLQELERAIRKLEIGT